MSVQWLEIPRPLRDTDPHLTMALLTWKNDHPRMSYYWNQLMALVTKFYEVTQTSVMETIEFDTTLVLRAPFDNNTPDQDKLMVVPPLPKFIVTVDLSYNRIIDLNPLNGHLQNIDLGYNQIQTLTTLKLPYLKQLDLSHNNIVMVPHLLIMSESLVLLDIAYNQVTSLPTLNNKNSKLTYHDNPVYMEHLQTLEVDVIDPSWCYAELVHKLQLNLVSTCPSDWKDCVSKKVHDLRYQHCMDIMTQQAHLIEGLQIKVEGLIAIQHTLFDKFQSIQSERQYTSLLESTSASSIYSNSVSSPIIIKEEEGEQEEYKQEEFTPSKHTRKRQQMMMSDELFFPCSVVNEFGF
jgi:hypothetical protein